LVKKFQKVDKVNFHFFEPFGQNCTLKAKTRQRPSQKGPKMAETSFLSQIWSKMTILGGLGPTQTQPTFWPFFGHSN